MQPNAPMQQQPDSPMMPNQVQVNRTVSSRVDTTAVSPADRAAQVVYILFGFVEGLIAIRVLLKLFAANPDAGFSALIYAITEPFVALFNGVFATPSSHGSVFEFSSVLAIIVYALLSWGVVRLIQVWGQRQTTTVSS